MSYYEKQREVRQFEQILNQLREYIDIPEYTVEETVDEYNRRIRINVPNPNYRKMERLCDDIICVVEELIVAKFDLTEKVSEVEKEYDDRMRILEDKISDLEHEVAPLRLLMI